MLPSEINVQQVALDYLKVSTPEFSLPSGVYALPQTGVEITVADTDAVIYYTLTTDGSEPANPTNGEPTQLYTGPFDVDTVNATTRIKAQGFVRGEKADSVIAEATYEIDLDQSAAPAFSMDSGVYSAPITVALSHPDGAATLRYEATTDGSEPADPSASSPVWPGDQFLNTEGTFRFKAFAEVTNQDDSLIVARNYTITFPTAAEPTFGGSLPGTYNTAQSITFSTTSAGIGADVLYTMTTDGSNPADPAVSGTVYTTPITAAAYGTTRIRAIASGTYILDSTELSGTWNIVPPSNTITVTDLTPGTKAVLKYGESVTIGFDYTVAEPGGAQIFARPMTAGSLTPGYAASGSPTYPLGSGSVTANFSIGSGTDVVIDQIRFQFTSGATVYDEIFVNVDYRVEPTLPTLESVDLTGLLPEDMVSLDWDGDGDDEIIVARLDTAPDPDTVEMNMYDWDGSLINLWGSGVQTGYPNGLVAADLTGDGNIDLIEGRNSTLLWEHEFSAARFKTPVQVAAPLFSGTAVVGPVTSGDGRPDFAMASSGSAIEFYEQAVDGTFSLQATLPGGANSNEVIAMNLDGDGLLDLVHRKREAREFYVYRNDDNFNFTNTYTGSLGGNLQSVTAGDLNGDGLDDLLADQLGGALFVYSNDGGGSFTQRASLPVGDTVYDAFVVDFNGDGDNDIVVARFSAGELRYYENEGNWNFREYAYTIGAGSSYTMIVGDFDGNGVYDIAEGKFVTSVGTLYVQYDAWLAFRSTP